MYSGQVGVQGFHEILERPRPSTLAPIFDNELRDSNIAIAIANHMNFIFSDFAFSWQNELQAGGGIIRSSWFGENLHKWLSCPHDLID